METGEIGMLGELMAELSHADGEHTDVSVQHESGWALSVFPSRHVVLENLESDEPPRSAYLATDHDCLLAMQTVARGLVDNLGSLNWEEGYGSR
jgi:hypothetical protein